MSNQTELSIISFNTLGVPIISKHLTERYVTLAKSIKMTDANILSFQEVHTYVHLHILKRFLPEYPYVIYKRYLYGPQGGLVIFSKLPVSSHTFINFHNKGSMFNKTFYTRITRTGMLSCTLRDLPITIIDTYLTTNPDQNWELHDGFSALQQSQLSDLIETVRTLKQKNGSIVVAGDFNFTKQSGFYQEFLDKTQATDAFDKVGLPTYLFERKPLKFSWQLPFLDKFFVFNAKRSGQVDFIFAIPHSNKVEIKDKKFLFDEKVQLFNGRESYLSDHLGLYTKMKFDI